MTKQQFIEALTALRDKLDADAEMERRAAFTETHELRFACAVARQNALLRAAGEVEELIIRIQAAKNEVQP